MSFLERQISLSRNSRFADTLELFLSNRREAEAIREWFKRNSRTRRGDYFRRSESNADCEDWEAELWFFANRYSDFHPMDKWETAPAKDRKRYAEKVAKLALELADVLEEEVSPYYPPVLEFFDTERAIDIIRAFPEETAQHFLAGYSYDWRTGYARNPREEPRSPSYNLAGRFGSPEAQEFPSLLRRLAEYSESQSDKPKRDKRPDTGDPNARAFARHIARYFALFFRNKPTPNEVIAACVALKYPDMSPPGGRDIENWLRP